MPDPRRWLSALSAQYVRNWLDHPDRYRMGFLTVGVSQSDVGVFVSATGAIGRFAIFFASIASCRTDLDAGRLRLLGETLVCGLHGIAHGHVKISAYPWQDPDAQVECLVTALITER